MNLPQKLVVLLLGAAFALSAAVPEYLVIGKSPGKLEKKAVEELKLFYKKIYKKELKTISEKAAAGKSVIFLGDTAFSRKNGIDRSKAGKEEWILKTRGKNLIITGGLPAGTLYGVYELLEKLGVVFASFDETFIPKNKPDFPQFDVRKQPAFEGRLIFDGIPYKIRSTRAPKSQQAIYHTWTLRNRINGQQIPEMLAFYRGTMFNHPRYPYHNFFDYLPRSLYKKHPEYFQMDERGRRREPREHRYRGGMCMTNPDVRRIVLNSLRKMIQEDRKRFPQEDWPCVYDISRLDDAPFLCYCEPCKAVSDSDSPGSETGLLMDFINHIAREIRKEYPDIIIRTFGEKSAPKKILPEKNVLIWIDDAFSRHSPFVPTEHNATPWLEKYRKGWIDISERLMMWDYWNLGGRYFTPPRVETIFDTIRPDLKYFKKSKVRAMFIEAGMDSCAPQNFMMLNYYVANHLMVDLDADAEKLADDFLRVYYGPAYRLMKKYFNLIREGVRKQPQPQATSCGGSHWRYLTPQFMLTMYKELNAAAAKLPANSRFARRIRTELAAPIWYTLINWQSYADAFTSAGITRKALIAECRKIVREVILSFNGTRTATLYKQFEERFKTVTLDLPRPEKFKNVPEKNFKMLSYADFKNVGMFKAAVVQDPDSITGRALKSADPRPERHGINKLLNKRHKFYTTQFVLGNHRAPGRIKTYLKAVAQDEKYHWYRIPGSIELRPVCDFWGHGWAIQAPANRFFLLTTGDPADNTWDQCWFSAKFTGPAYVPGSKKENAIFVDMMVLTRGEKDNEFIPVPAYAALNGKDRTGKLPAGWELVRYYQPAGKAVKSSKDGKPAIKITGHPKKVTGIEGPKFDCGPNDVVKIRVRTTGKKCRVGLYRYGKKTFIRGHFVTAPDSGRQNEFIFDMSDLPRSGENARCSLAFNLLPGEKECVIDQIEVSVAKDLNKIK